MSANPLANARIAVRSRLAYQLRALRALYSPLLNGQLATGLNTLFSGNELSLKSASDLDGMIRQHESKSAAAKSDANLFDIVPAKADAIERLAQFHRIGLATSAGIASSQAETSQPPPPMSNRFTAWSWRHASTWNAGLPSVSAATREGMMAVHELLVCQLAAENLAQLGGKNGVARALTQTRPALLAHLEKTLKNPSRQRLETGDMLSHWLAVEALVFVVVAARTPRGQQVAEPLPRFWQCLTPDLVPLVARLLSANTVILDAYPDVRQQVHKHVPSAGFKSLSIVPHVQQVLFKLQKFGGELVIKKQPQDVRRPLLIGDVARTEIEKFSALDSPALTSDESQKLRDSLHRELREAELKLFRATVIPRPAFYNAFIDWAARHVVLTTGVHFPLSAAALDIVFFCHNLLALDRALAELKKAEQEKTKNVAALEQEVEKIRESLVAPAEVLDRLDPEIGDMLVIYRSVEGLQASFAQRHAGTPQVAWDRLLPSLAHEVRAHLLALAAKSPLVRLTNPALEKVLGEFEPSLALDRFLDHSQAEPLRDFAAGELAALVVADPTRMETFGRRGLQKCLETGTLGGALLVAEFIQMLFQKLFVPCDVAAAAIRDPHEAATAKERQAAAKAFGQWFFNLDEPRTKALFEILVGLMQATIEHAGPADATDPRAAILRHRWRAITQVATRGLFRRPWQPDAQRLLRMFWLNFCLKAYEHFDILPPGLNTGNRTIDDLTTFGCWLTGELHRTLRAYDLQRQRQERLKRTQEFDESSLTISETRESYVKDELKIMKSRLMNVATNPKFRNALIVRRMLDRSGKTWNQERIDQFVAFMSSQRR